MSHSRLSPDSFRIWKMNSDRSSSYGATGTSPSLPKACSCGGARRKSWKWSTKPKPISASWAKPCAGKSTSAEAKATPCGSLPTSFTLCGGNTPKCTTTSSAEMPRTSWSGSIKESSISACSFTPSTSPNTTPSRFRRKICGAWSCGRILRSRQKSTSSRATL